MRRIRRCGRRMIDSRTEAGGILMVVAFARAAARPGVLMVRPMRLR